MTFCTRRTASVATSRLGIRGHAVSISEVDRHPLQRSYRGKWQTDLKSVSVVKLAENVGANFYSSVTFQLLTLDIPTLHCSVHNS